MDTATSEIVRVTKISAIVIVSVIFSVAYYIITFSPFLFETRSQVIESLQFLTILVPVIILSPWFDTPADNTQWFAFVFWSLVVLQPFFVIAFAFWSKKIIRRVQK